MQASAFNLLLLLLYCLSSAVPAFAAEEMNMSGAVERGLKANPGLQAVKEELQGSDYGVKAAKSAFAPQFSSGYGYTKLDRPPSPLNKNRDRWRFHFNIHQPICTGFQLLAAHEKAKLIRENKEAKLKKARLELTARIRQTFLSLLAFREEERSARQALERLQAHLRVSRAFYESGVKTKLDVLQAQSDVAEARQQLLTARMGSGTQKARLDSLLAVDSQSEEISYHGRLNFIPVKISLPECLREAKLKRPDVKMAQKSALIASEDARIVASDFYPELGADFDYYRYGDGPEVDGSEFQDPSEWQMGVSLQWKFFEWGKTYFEYKQARKGQMRIEAELEDLLLNVQFEVKASYLDIQTSKQKIKVARSGLREAKEGYRMAKARYQSQVGTSTEVLDAQTRLAESEANLTAALKEYLSAAVNLLSAIGREKYSIMNAPAIY